MLDDTDWHILTILQTEARLPFAELGRRVGLSPSSVAERVRKLEDSGIIVGYRAEINPGAIGLSLRILIDVITTPQQYPQVIEFMEHCPAVQSAHHVTGNTSFRIEALVGSIAEVEPLIGKLSHYGQTTTSIVLSSPVRKTAIAPPGDISTTL
ncbi:MAG: Lrp/AsnC family transcriptional regulator [Merismopedia sp. SIO2A8]|nr:Lrp/AsnC family transcriptional regulator [Merismopedia sp. SIO2A8]